MQAVVSVNKKLNAIKFTFFSSSPSDQDTDHDQDGYWFFRITGSKSGFKSQAPDPFIQNLQDLKMVPMSIWRSLIQRNSLNSATLEIFHFFLILT